MMIYLSLLLIPPVVLFLLRKKENQEKLTLIITCSFAFLLLALRSKLSGVDMTAYYRMYETLKDVSFINVLKDFRLLRRGEIVGVEWGYTLFTWIFARTRLPFQALLITQSAFCMYSLYRFINKYSNKPSLSIVIAFGFGIFDYYYCILRQAISFAILLYSVDFVEKKKYLFAALLVFAATLFHQSALIFIVAIPFCFVPINWKTSLIFLGLSFLILPFYPILDKILVEGFLRKFYHTGYRSYGFVFGELIIVLLAVALFMTFFYTKKKEISPTDRFIYWIVMLTVPLQFFSMYFTIIGRLLTLTFLPFSSVGITNAFIKKGEKEDKVTLILELAIFLAMCLYYIFCLYYDKRGLQLIPYEFFFAE